MARLKQAKDEAEREIASYRALREAEFWKKVETSGDFNFVLFLDK